MDWLPLVLLVAAAAVVLLLVSRRRDTLRPGRVRKDGDGSFGVYADGSSGKSGKADADGGSDGGGDGGGGD